jgi:glucose-1-phosphate adenylyltransferase
VPRAEASGFGVMAVDASWRITDFVEKPADPPPMPGQPNTALASMGIYIFNREYLFKTLARDVQDENSGHDFGHDIVPHAVREGVAMAHPFGRSGVVGAGGEPYWRDVGTIDAYWDAHIDLTAARPLLDLYDQRWPILTFQPQLPPAKFISEGRPGSGSATDSLVSGGCIVAGHVSRSVLFSSVRLEPGAQVERSVLLPYVRLGRDVRLSRVVIDRGCELPDGMVIGEDPAQDARRFERSAQGITLVTREMLARL